MKTKYLLLAVFGLLPTAGFAQGSIHGVVTRVDPQGDSTPLAGITVTLSGIPPANEAATLTAENGSYEFTGLAEGTFTLRVAMDGFQPFAKTVVVREKESAVQDIKLELATVAASVEVQAEAVEITARSEEPSATLTDREFPSLPMPEQRVTEALRAVPGVVRTMDGTLNIKGEAESQGMLLVDSSRMVDPVTGSFAVGVPLAAVETLNVYEAPYNAQYGGFSGGLTTIETKAPPSQWQYSLMDFVPGARGKNGHIVGISAETPRLYVGGPLIKDKLNISESLDYVIRNRPVRGQPWPINESRTRGFTSFTNLQAILSPRNLFTASVTSFSMRTQFADIDSLVPQTASSNSGTKGAYATAAESRQFSTGTLLTSFRYSRVDSNAYGQGGQALSITPEGLGGNAFNNWSRTANQFEGSPMFQFSRKQWHGSHELTVGADVVHQYYTGTSRSRPILILREDRSLAERIDFSGSNALNGAQTEVSQFAQDHWTLSDRLAVDLGFRLSTQSNGRTAAAAPRLGFAYALDRSNKTALRGGVGVFYDRVPMLAATFQQNPTRVVSLFDNNGGSIGAPTVLENAYLDSRSKDPGTSPRNTTWNLEVDRELTSNASVRVSYLHSQTSSVFVVAPWSDGARSELGMAHSGNSRYREFQAAAHYRAGRRVDLNVAYLWTESKGSLNTLSNTYVPFEAPVIRASMADYLASDIPHRVLGSGIFHLPKDFTVSPVIDAHTGFRYSKVDVLNNYVGRPNSERFPTYFSLDMKVYRDFPLPAFAGRLRDHRFRIGVYSMNVTNHSNPHDVFNNVTSPLFGRFVGFQHRVNGMLIDIVK